MIARVVEKDMDEHEHRIERLDRFQETVSRAGELVSSGKEKLEKLSAQAGDVVSKVTEAAASQGDTIGKLAVETSRTAQQKILDIASDGKSAAALLIEERDRYLLGAAALALTAALGVSYSKRQEQH